MTRTVVIIHEDQWPVARDVRLASLRTDPDAFGANLAEETAFSEAQWRDFVRRQAVLVVFDDQAAVALTLVESFDGDFGATCWLGGCWVTPSARGSGVLRSILRFMDEEGPSRNWMVPGLGVWEENAGAIAAYQAVGFVIMGDPVISTRRPPRRYLRMIRRPQN